MSIKYEELPGRVQVMFENIVARIETEGLVMWDNSIVLKVTVTEYASVIAYWDEFKDYVVEETKKWKPTRTIEESYKNYTDYYVHFGYTWLWKLRNFVKHVCADNSAYKPSYQRGRCKNNEKF